MDVKKIQELIDLMELRGIKRLVIREAGFEVELEKAEERVKHPTLPPPVPIAPQIHNHVVPTQPETADSKNKTYVTSPMVGTFYASSAPGEKSFVQVGDNVEKDTIVCIIEAMKVMNEIKAGTAGRISEILVQSGRPVEFGTKLFTIS